MHKRVCNKRLPSLDIPARGASLPAEEETDAADRLALCPVGVRHYSGRRSALDDLVLGVKTVSHQVDQGHVKVAVRREALDELMGLLDRFEFWFPIVTPRAQPAPGTR